LGVTLAAVVGNMEMTSAAASSGMAERVKQAAREFGFDACGICDLRPIERRALGVWIERGYAGSMGYMHRQALLRQEPQRIAPHCRRAVVVLKNYYREQPARPDTLDHLVAGDSPLWKRGVRGDFGEREPALRVARYAWGEDYHRVLGDRLRDLARVLMDMGASGEHTRWYVDAGPVPERELAERAGLGWIAKNTMLIHPSMGSFTFIGTVFTDLDLEIDPPFSTDHCGSCRLCLDSCPTRAFPEERVLDARRCISYLTIEHRGPFDAEQGVMVGNWLFGCDLCQDVCPWNIKFASPTTESRFAVRREVVEPDLEALARMEGETFEQTYSDTAFERPGAAGIARNARQVLANSRRCSAHSPQS
jgi:epoxyqueuosine reductase